MKPAWDKLMEEFKDSKATLVADVDCTAAGESLCSDIGVRGYPTIKHGDPNNLEDYKGGRDFDSLKKFAEENLGPTCGPANLDMCDDARKVEIEKFSKMSASDLEASITEKTVAVEKLETDFKEFIEGYKIKYAEAKRVYRESMKKQNEYEEVNRVYSTYEEAKRVYRDRIQKAKEKKDKDVAAVKDSRLGLMMAVVAHNKTSKSEL